MPARPVMGHEPERLRGLLELATLKLQHAEFEAYVDHVMATLIP